MQLDVRLPIGWMFSIFGLLLAGFGLASDPKLYQRSMNTNINLYWGVVMLVFGVIMLALAWRGKSKRNGQ